MKEFKLNSSNEKFDELKEIFADAMRYRFLRDYADPAEGHVYASIEEIDDSGEWGAFHKSGKELDKLIDSIIKK